MPIINRASACAAAIAIVWSPGAASAQDKDQVRAQAKAGAAQLRAAGEPKDRCATGAEVQAENVVTRTYGNSAFALGDEVLAINGTDVAGKTPDQTSPC